MQNMELENNRTEITIRLLQNGRYLWTITANTDNPHGAIQELKLLDRELGEAFPNHVTNSSVKFHEFSDE